MLAFIWSVVALDVVIIIVTIVGQCYVRRAS